MRAWNETHFLVRRWFAVKSWEKDCLTMKVDSYIHVFLLRLTTPHSGANNSFFFFYSKLLLEKSYLYNFMQAKGSTLHSRLLFSPSLSFFTEPNYWTRGSLKTMKNRKAGPLCWSLWLWGKAARSGFRALEYFLSNNQLEVGSANGVLWGWVISAGHRSLLWSEKGWDLLLGSLRLLHVDPPTRNLHPSCPLLPRQEVSHSLVWPWNKLLLSQMQGHLLALEFLHRLTRPSLSRLQKEKWLMWLIRILQTVRQQEWKKTTFGGCP